MLSVFNRGHLAASTLLPALTLAVLTGCDKTSEAPKQPCKRGATVEVRVVDNDSPHMKRLYRDANPDASGRAQEPTAAAADIRAEVDHWNIDATTTAGVPVERISQTDYFLYAFDRGALEKYVTSLGAPPEGREILFERIAARPGVTHIESREHWRTHFVQASPIIDTSSIVDVASTHSPEMDAPMLLFTLTPEGRAELGRRTAQLVGKKVAIVIDGTVTNAPIINGAIPGGRFTVLLDDETTARTLFAKLACTR